jgi:tRNA-Thr(GGU) m(6)t(6)A37 methyltransferase TsaA
MASELNDRSGRAVVAADQLRDARVESFAVRAIGVVRSPLRDLDQAPRQPDEGAPEAELVFDGDVVAALEGIEAGAVVELLTWLHRASRDTLQTRPRSDPTRPVTGVFATRSPDRPNPIGLHTVTVLEAGHGSLRVAGLEAIDGTPVLDVKIALGPPDLR